GSRGRGLELFGLLHRERLGAVEESFDERRVAVGRDERREHLDMTPSRAVDGALVRSVDVGLHRTTAPRLAARRQLDVVSAFRSAADGAAAAGRLLARLADERV